MSNQNDLIQKAIDEVNLKFSNCLISDLEACTEVENLIEGRIKEIMTVEVDIEHSDYSKLRMIKNRIRRRERFLEGISIGGLATICAWKIFPVCVKPEPKPEPPEGRYGDF